MAENLARIVIMGIGGGGNNCIKRMIDCGLKGIEFYAVNTDLQQLMRMQNCQTIQIGEKITRGLGAGGDPEIGRRAVTESRDEIGKVLEGADIALITTGLGGGTGTGATPEIAAISKNLDVLTISVVTLPFKFEGRKRKEQAIEGLKKVLEHADSIIVISNELLLKNSDANTGFLEAFAMADDVAKDAVQAITDLLTQTGLVAGLIHVDLEDIKTILKDAGPTLIGIGYGQGENRALDAAKQALHSPLLEIGNIKGAKRILVNITGNENLTLYETEKAASYITNEADPDANIIFGSTIIPEWDEKIKITVLIGGLQSDLTY
ncbi:MAG TPA: cell division protein FtsZ [bacterium]|nr:cell division protein FtsZ [bacterium]